MMTEHQKITGSVITDTMINAERHALTALQNWHMRDGGLPKDFDISKWRLTMGATSLGTVGFEVDYEWEYVGG